MLLNLEAIDLCRPVLSFLASEGCDAFVLFHDDSFGNKSHLVEKKAISNKTSKGFNIVDLIKEELERENIK